MPDINESILAPILKKFNSEGFKIRFLATWAMIFGFSGLIYFGRHLALLLFILVCQIAMFREIVILGQDKQEMAGLPRFKKFHWYYFGVACFYFYGGPWGMLVRYHTLISFFLYVLGFVGYVLMLKRGHLMFQFAHLAWCTMTILVACGQGTLIMSTVFKGLIWLILPGFLIVCNDIWAYMFGYFLGKHPLIKLSPNKTWEGFMGGFLMTIIFSFIFTSYMQEYEFMTCPKTDGFVPSIPSCEIEPIFITEPTPFHFPLVDFASISDIPASLDFVLNVSPMHWHALYIALFASIVSPFGGFFASGLKRALKIKDFGDSIPGHGGISDRMDCQVSMGVFVYVYMKAFVNTRTIAMESVLSLLDVMTRTQKEQVLKHLSNELATAGAHI